MKKIKELKKDISETTKNISETKKTTIKNFAIVLFIISFTVIVLVVMNVFLPREYYTANDFNIKTIYSNVDYDEDLIDDYSDFVLGAREDMNNKPTYISKYYSSSYPPNNEGVCTDVIWRAFKHSGYSLKDMLDQDIKNYPEEYPDASDSNIDFRGVRNLNVFFKKYSISLTLDPDDYKEWQPGDIVVFGDNKHIGIISDRRNRNGIPYVIHNNGPYTQEEDYLTKSRISGHYRFDAEKIDKEILKKWTN